MRIGQRYPVMGIVNAIRGLHTEAVIQDVAIPIKNAPAFLEFFQNEIRITPVWACPVQPYNSEHNFDLFPLREPGLHINFGFWDTVYSKEKKPAGYFNRLVEEKVDELKGIKSLYSNVFYDEETFRQNYSQDVYDQLKKKYDSTNRFPSLYERVVKSKR